MEGLTPDRWLDLGLPGAAMFIVVLVVVLLFKQQSKSVDKLCSKIDELVTSFSTNNLKLNEVIIVNDRDQKEMISCVNEVKEIARDIQKRVIRLDARNYDKERKEEMTDA